MRTAFAPIVRQRKGLMDLVCRAGYDGETVRRGDPAIPVWSIPGPPEGGLARAPR